MNTLREYLIELIIVTLLTVIGITYVAPAVGERLRERLINAANAGSTRR